jgi:hypothetical protein
MNLRFRGICTFTLLLSLAVFSAARTAHAQMPDTPPIKMGLWQTEVTTTMAGMENTPMGGHMGGDHKQITQSCMTPESWKNDLLKMREQQNKCSMADLHLDAHGMSFAETCSDGNQYTTTVHFQATFDSDEQMHGTATAHTAGPAFPQGMSMNMQMTSHYLGASCGEVKPGSAKIIH